MVHDDGPVGLDQVRVCFTDELVARLARAGATGVKLLRADSGFWNSKVFARLERAGWLFSIGVRMTAPVREGSLAEQMTRETGNAVWETKFEVQRTAEILRLSADEARRVSAAGEHIPIDAVPRGEGQIRLHAPISGGHRPRDHALQRPALARRAQARPRTRGRLPLHRAAGVEDPALGALAR